jgi:cytochrome c5
MMKMLSSHLFLLVTLMVGVQLSAQANNDRPFGERSIFSKTATDERLAPVAKVCLEGQECDSKTKAELVVADAGASAEPLTGEKIYQNHCAMCHTSGAAGAPKLGDKAAWQTRLTATGGIDKLSASAVTGKGAMPAKGLCMTCTDADIKNTVQYIVDHSK